MRNTLTRGVCKNGPGHAFFLKSTLGIVPHLIQGFLGPNPARERFSRFCTVYSCGVCPMQSNRLTNTDHATCGTCIKTPHLRNDAAQKVWWKIGGVKWADGCQDSGDAVSFRAVRYTTNPMCRCPMRRVKFVFYRSFLNKILFSCMLLK